jgi:hypothetical protein
MLTHVHFLVGESKVIIVLSRGNVAAAIQHRLQLA